VSFNNLTDMLNRLERPEPLSDGERRDLYTWMTEASGQNRHMLDLELTRRLLHAIREFEMSSRKLTRWLIRLTVILVILTIVIAGFTILLWTRG